MRAATLPATRPKSTDGPNGTSDHLETATPRRPSSFSKSLSSTPRASSTALLNPEVPSFVLDESTRNCRAVLRSMPRWPGLKTRHQLDDSTSDLSAPEFSPSSVAAGRNAYLQNASHVSGLSASTNAHIWDRSISTEGSQFRDVRFAFLLPAKFDWLAPNVPRSRR